MIESNPAMTLVEAIHLRRSVRDYASRPIDAATVEALLAAAVRAPTAMHREPWEFVVIQDQALLRRISDRAKALFVAEARREHLDRGDHSLDAFERPEVNVFYNAGTLVVICARTGGAFAAADCWLAAENLMLAACALGLGSCVIGSAVAGLNTREVRAEIGIPADVEAVAPIIIGVPAADALPTPRQAPLILAWVGR